jgi:peptidoglycan hydrolase-like protein with peptidoglycan-binding domain
VLVAEILSQSRKLEVLWQTQANPIGVGSIGDAVRRFQRALRRTPNLGISVDGVFGPITEIAVKKFQQGAGLVVDGVVGPQTWGLFDPQSCS